MNFLAKRVSNIKPSPTIAATAKATELKSNGLDVIGLGAGEPDFDTPVHIKNAAIEAINSGKTKYTAVDGIKELKSQISEKFNNDNEIDYSLNEITVGTGGKQVLYNALMATINKGDEVIVPAPYWVSYPDMVILADGNPVIAKCEEKDDFKLTPEILEKNITSKTKWLILNSPSNPTGIGYEEKELKDLSVVLEKNPHVLIMVDDMYEYLTYDNFSFTTLVQVNKNLKDRVLTCNGVSKSFCMTGWRIGYAGGPEWLIKAMSKIQSQSTSNPNSIAQWASKAALEGEMTFLKSNLDAFEKRRNFVVEGLNNVNGLKCKMPNGAFYVFPNCGGVLGKKTPKGKVLNSDSDYCDYLLEEGLVATVPGIAFGLSPYFRISYATSDINLEKAIERIENVTNKLT